MKENYKAWTINFEDFHKQKSMADQLNFLVRFAILAPSGHNAQAWKFIVQKNTILLSPERLRSIGKSDPQDRQLFISLGCALENLLVAADYYNFDTNVKYFPEDHENIAAKIIFNKRASNEVSENHLILAIPNRHTNRNKYESRIPDKNFIDRLKNLTNEEIRVDIIEDKVKKDMIADMSVQALIKTMDESSFREELSPYIKSNFTRSKVGMPGHGHGMPDPVSLFASKLIRHVNVKRLDQKKDEKVFKNHTPLFCILSGKKNNEEIWVKTGQLFERIALEAERNNIKTAPLAAATQREEYSENLKKLLNTDFQPLVLLRLGYCSTPARPTPRLLQNEVTHNI